MSRSRDAAVTTAIKQEARTAIQQQSNQFVRLARDIHAHPELAFVEECASNRISNFLADEGFALRRGAFGLPTAFAASFGSGPLHLAFCAEYDAADFAGNGPQHECGHNLIAGAAVAAATGLRGVADSVGLTVSVVGTPGEELLGLRNPTPGHLVSGKIVLLEAGAFDGVHAALMVHPAPTPYGVVIPSKAGIRLHARFTGPSPDGGGLTPARARALERALHRAVRSAGQWLYFCAAVPDGDGAQAQADIFWGALSLSELMGARGPIRRCLEEAASSAGLGVEITEYRPNAEMRHDPVLTAAYRRNAEALGRERENDERIPAELRRLRNQALLRTLTHPGDLRKLARLASHKAVGLFLDEPPVDVLYGTDLGNVSQVVPSIHPMLGIGGVAPNHTTAFAAQTDSEEAYLAMIDGGVALAWTALDAATDPELRRYLIEESSRFSPRTKADYRDVNESAIPAVGGPSIRR
jgi:metal-dependent amidase/aminoacylase/carboxypeptidase family protein